jgi:hypothetical protein
VIVKTVDPWLETMFDAEHIDGTMATLVAAIEEGADDEEEAARRQAARAAVARCDARLEGSKQALDEGGDPTVIGPVDQGSVRRAGCLHASGCGGPAGAVAGCRRPTKLRRFWPMCGPLRPT